jgi:hypothetical protein
LHYTLLNPPALLELPMRPCCLPALTFLAFIVPAVHVHAQPTSMPQATDGVTRLTLEVFDTDHDHILSESERHAAVERCGSIGDPATEGSAPLTDDQRRELLDACMGL